MKERKLELIEQLRNAMLEDCAALKSQPAPSSNSILVCKTCGEPQFDTPSGVTCINGHGGEEGISQEEYVLGKQPARESGQVSEPVAYVDQNYGIQRTRAGIELPIGAQLHDHAAPCARCADHVEEIKRLQEELFKIKEAKFRRFNNEDCWIYQGDGTDDLASLVCPVVISADKLAALEAENSRLGRLVALDTKELEKVDNTIAQQAEQLAAAQERIKTLEGLLDAFDAADKRRVEQLAAAEKDTERLDWVIQQGDEYHQVLLQDQPGDGEYAVSGAFCNGGQGKTVREAIDAAIAASREGKS